VRASAAYQADRYRGPSGLSENAPPPRSFLAFAFPSAVAARAMVPPPTAAPTPAPSTAPAAVGAGALQPQAQAQAQTQAPVTGLEEARAAELVPVDSYNMSFDGRGSQLAHLPALLQLVGHLCPSGGMHVFGENCAPALPPVTPADFAALEARERAQAQQLGVPHASKAGGLSGFFDRGFRVPDARASSGAALNAAGALPMGSAAAAATGSGRSRTLTR
jgi:hypothetical protein